MLGNEQHQVFTFVSVTFNSLSFLSCLWIFFLYRKSAVDRTIQSKMLVNLTLSDFLIAITGFLTHFSPKYDHTCACNIFLSLVGYWSSAFWSSAVALFSYKKIAMSGEFNSTQFYIRSLFLWALLCVTIPLLPVFGLFGVQYIAEGEFCAISLNTSPFVLFLITEGIPFTTAIFITAVSYIKQIKALKALPEFLLTMINVKASKLTWYPIAQCLVFLPGLVCQLIYVFMPYQNIVVNVIRLYGFRLAGLVNSVVYGLQRVSLGKSQKLFGESTRSQSFLVQDPEGLYGEMEDEEDFE